MNFSLHVVGEEIPFSVSEQDLDKAIAEKSVDASQSFKDQMSRAALVKVMNGEVDPRTKEHSWSFYVDGELVYANGKDDDELDDNEGEEWKGE